MNNWKEKFNSLATLPNFALLIIFLLPLYLIRLQIFAPTNLLEVLILIFLLFFVLDKNNWKKLKVFFQKEKKYLVVFAILILGFLISTFSNGHVLKSLGIIKGWLILPFLFSVLANLLFEKAEKRKLFISYFYCTLLVSLLGIAFIFLGQLTYDGRLRIFFNSPNYLAMFLAPAFLWGFFLLKKGFWRKSLPLAILGTALFFTFSYLAWVALGSALCLVALRASKIKLGAFLVAGALIGLVILALALKTEKMRDTLSLAERSSFSSRIMIWQSAGKIFAENWVWGIGPANFQEKYLVNQKYYEPYLEWAVPHPHSLYLAFWLGGGIIGFLSFLLLLFWRIKNFFFQKEKETILTLVSLGIIVYFLLHGLADTTYFKNDLAIIFWLAFFALP